MRRLAVSTLAAMLALTMSAALALADWPTTCVDLNDLAEAAAGRSHNVGVYQRVAGAGAEAACQHDHRADVQRAFAWALGGSGGAAVAGVWPTTCVALSDLAEAARGDPRNVGIYQRVYVHDFAAESACRSDHRADVVATFAWAVPPPPTASTPPPTATPAPAAQPSEHPDYWRVYDVAEARGAAPVKADAIAASVVGREVYGPGAVDRFLRGEDPGVEYGLHACDWHSAACPLAPVYEPPEPPPASDRIDAGLRLAWDLMSSTPVGARLLQEPGADTVTVWWDWNRLLQAGSLGRYYPSTHAIWINPDVGGERQAALAALLAHELWHATSPLKGPGTYRCIADEVWALATEAAVWREIGGAGAARSSLERQLDRALEALRADLALGRSGGDDWEDISIWPNITDEVYARGYGETCAA